MSLACVTSTTMYALKAMQVTRVEITQAFLIPVSKCHKFTLQLQMCCFLSKKKEKKNIYIYHSKFIVTFHWQELHKRSYIYGTKKMH